ncbi:MAG: hypothetical protein GY877_08175 [Hyphomicrobium sp.]|nr:hypothetical protein [Hyphomicrobium sp.]
MRRIVMAVAACFAMSAASYADCKSDIAAALTKQRSLSSFRMDSVMLTSEGRIHMVVDYLLPDRMRQMIGPVGDPKPVETVLIGKKAWSRKDGDWKLMSPQTTSALVDQLRQTVSDDEERRLPGFECLGKVTVDGRDLLAYQGENEDPNAKKSQAKDKPKLPDRPVRVIYVDPTTGLPVRSVFGRANRLDTPIFEAKYTYPVDIEIKLPQTSTE